MEEALHSLQTSSTQWLRILFCLV